MSDDEYIRLMKNAIDRLAAAQLGIAVEQFQARRAAAHAEPIHRPYSDDYGYLPTAGSYAGY